MYGIGGALVFIQVLKSSNRFSNPIPIVCIFYYISVYLGICNDSHIFIFFHSSIISLVLYNGTSISIILIINSPYISFSDIVVSIFTDHTPEFMSQNFK